MKSEEYEAYTDIKVALAKLEHEVESVGGMVVAVLILAMAVFAVAAFTLIAVLVKVG